MSMHFINVVALVTLTLSVPAVGCSQRGSGKENRPAPTVSDLIRASSAGQMLLNVPVPAALPNDTDIVVAERYVRDHADYTAYHLLFLLHDQSPKAYEAIPADTKARVLCSALANCTLMNDWGYLAPEGCQDSVSAKALLALGDAALPYLEPQLDDMREAYLFGSEEATVSFDLGYRRADFAYRYSMLILGHNPAFPGDPAERDKLIDALKADILRRGVRKG